MAKKFPILPKYPERVCWGCDAYCPAHDLRCGNGTVRTQHPIETEGEDWYLYDEELVLRAAEERAKMQQNTLKK